jgi:uncharacterized protein (TIGR02678 family)
MAEISTKRDGLQPLPTGPDVRARVEAAQQHDRQRAFRALLRSPLLTSDGEHADDLSLVKRHADWLREWLARNTNWRLQIEADFARLRKVPSDPQDDTRPAIDRRTRTGFTKRRYVMFCLALASLERADRQVVLGRVAQDILEFAAADRAFADAGIVFDLTDRDQRRDLVQAVRLLLDLQVIIRVDGDEEQYLSQRGDVLYTINRPVLAVMMNVNRGPSTITEHDLTVRIEAMLQEPIPDTEDGRNRHLRCYLVARLLDDPVLYYAELDERQVFYLHSQRGRLLREIETATGLVAEVRAEGIAMVDPGGEMTDMDMPEEGTDGHLALLLAEALAKRFQPGVESPAVGISELRQHVASLIEQHRSHWRKDVAEPGAEMPLLTQTLQRLKSLRLIRWTDGVVAPLPAIARYALGDPVIPDAEPGNIKGADDE